MIFIGNVKNFGWDHSKWDLVGDSGGSPGSENAVVGSRQIRPMQACSFLYLLPITYEQAREKCEPVVFYT